MAHIPPHDQDTLADLALVEAARQGDPQALRTLVAACLPFVYNIVGRAMDGHVDVDDVVQNTMLRAVDGLGELREPERFRSWLVAIAVRQVRTWWHTRQNRPSPVLPEEMSQERDPQADFADVTILRLDLGGQRREAVEAGRWLEDDDREVLSLWWMEAAGRLTRSEWTSAEGMTAEYAAVRVKRVKDRLEAARGILRALAVSPRCEELTGLLPSWDGRPGPLWRKRLHRHVRACPMCARVADSLVPAEGLLGGLALVPLPVGLAAHLLASLPAAPASTPAASHDPGASTQASRTSGRATTKLTSGPVSAVAAGALTVACLVGWGLTRDDSPEQRAAPAPSTTTSAAPHPTRTPTPTPTPTRSPTPSETRSSTPSATDSLLGAHSLAAASLSGQYVAVPGRQALLAQVGSVSPLDARQAATFTVVRGLAKESCYSFRDDTGQYLRHYRLRMRRDLDDGSALFRSDATFCVETRAGTDSVALRSLNYPDRYVRYRDNGEVWLDPEEATDAFRTQTAFDVVAPWAG